MSGSLSMESLVAGVKRICRNWAFHGLWLGNSTVLYHLRQDLRHEVGDLLLEWSGVRHHHFLARFTVTLLLWSRNSWLRYHARLSSLVGCCCGLMYCAGGVLWYLVCEPPTASSPKGARVFCGIDRDPPIRCSHFGRMMRTPECGVAHVDTSVVVVLWCSAVRHPQKNGKKKEEKKHGRMKKNNEKKEEEKQWKKRKNMKKSTKNNEKSQKVF